MWLLRQVATIHMDTFTQCKSVYYFKMYILYLSFVLNFFSSFLFFLGVISHGSHECTV